jgi:hypothetical protein
MQAKPFRVLCMVPPSLVTKWADELLLEDKFRKHLRAWDGHRAHGAVYKTMTDVVVLRRMSDLQGRRGELRYGQHELPGGFYILNSNLIFRFERKVTQLYRTGWDAIIIDEAHHLNARRLLENSNRQLLANPKTATLLLTATPFQLSPQELKELFALTFGGYESPARRNEPFARANELYAMSCFKNYRSNLAKFFETGLHADAKRAERFRKEVEDLLIERIVRNQKHENRRYYLVNGTGQMHSLVKSPFRMGAAALKAVLSAGHTIQLNTEEARCYLCARDQISTAFASGRQTFVAGALRQLLSTWTQFRQSKAGRLAKLPYPRGQHPKTRACVQLVSQLIQREVERRKGGGAIGKVLIFTSYVGADRSADAPRDEQAYGTAATLKNAVISELQKRYGRASRRERKFRAEALRSALSESRGSLDDEEVRSLEITLNRFAGSVTARLLLHGERELRQECGELRKLLKAVPLMDVSIEDEEELRRHQERRERLLKQIVDRYGTRDLVARYDGATESDARDRHMRGFNSPFAPLVLICSSIGQEGIDLQRYCRHVVHYDLEWNPAKLEQREGRVDRKGRATTEPVNVYFLICQGTYDERVMHAMVNRFRWHKVLLASRSTLEAPPGKAREAESDPNWIKRLSLNLAPRSPYSLTLRGFRSRRRSRS